MSHIFYNKALLNLFIRELELEVLKDILKKYTIYFTQNEFY